MAPIFGFTFLLLVMGLGFTPRRLLDTPWRVPTGAFCALAALFCLIYSYISSDFSVLNVYQNSHHLKPLIYKISGAWGNHEGSMLLLLVILSGYSMVFALTNKSEYKDEALAVQGVVIGLFAAFTAFASNPFERNFPVPEQGLGLNPLLQDIGLALHPPLLYIGYVGFFAVFSLALAGLWREKVDRDLAAMMQPWLFFSWGFLTLGIGMGSWWAYRELGWGGYWFWDPVENVSLMPWIAATALIHCVKVTKRGGGFEIWTVLLAILTFILCLLGIFLVRSGLLTSVHSFAVDATRGFFIILLISVIGGLSLLVFALKAPKIVQKSENFGFFSQKMMILCNNYFLMVALFTVLLGVFYPIIAGNFFDSAISVGAGYYNKIFAILLVPFLGLLGASYFVGKGVSLRFWVFLGFSAILAAIFGFFVKNSGFLEIFLVFLVFFVVLAAAFSRKNASNLAHLGFGLVLLGVILSSYLGVTKEVNIKQGERIAVSGDLSVKFRDVEYASGANFVARRVVFDILHGGTKISELKPQLRYYPVTDQTTFEASIRHGMLGDLYLAAGNKDEKENYALRVYVKPFVYLIWVGCLVMFGAGGLGILRLWGR